MEGRSEGLETNAEWRRQNAETSQEQAYFCILHSAFCIFYVLGLVKSTFGTALADSGAANRG